MASPARIRLPLPPADEFNLSRRDGLTLVTPKKNKFVWSVEDRPYRSVILDEQGQVVSSGWPKFYNATEPSGADNDAALLAALASGEQVVFTDKLDGSLAIRSVIDGQVVFRTRGSWDGGPFGPAMRRVAERKYPVLLDPGFEPERSLLFEFVSASPEFRIVISYPEDDLVLLGAVRHADLRLADWPELEQLAAQHALKLVEAVELPTDLDELMAAVRGWERREGIVARAAQGQVLVKVKADAYLLLHRIKSHLTAKNIRALCLEHKVTSLDDFEAVLTGEGGDWEMVQDARPLVELFLAGQAEAQTRLAQLREQVLAVRDQLEAEEAGRGGYRAVRKRFAVEFASQLPGAQKSAAFSLMDEQDGRAYELLLREALDQSFASVEAEDEARLELLEEG